jgi:hypothetical protein
MAAPPSPPVRKLIQTTSAHEVRVWVEGRIKAGEMKNCAHLNILPWEWRNKEEPGETDEPPFFAPVCERQSFEWKYGYLTKVQQMHFLQGALDQNLVRCPENCRYYRSLRWAKTERHWRAFWSNVAVPFKWFARAAWQTQVVIIVGVVLIVILSRFPQWLPPLIDLVKAVRH